MFILNLCNATIQRELGVPMVVTADLIYRVFKNEFVEAPETEMKEKTH